MQNAKKERIVDITKNHQKLYWQGINEAWHYDIINCQHLIPYNHQHFIVSFSDSDVTDDQTQFVYRMKWIFFLWMKFDNNSILWLLKKKMWATGKFLLAKKWKWCCALEKLIFSKRVVIHLKCINDESSSYQIIWQ